MSVNYNAVTHAVTLRPDARLSLHRTFQLTVVGTGSSPITDALGTPLDGAGNGRPGSDFVTLITASNLVRDNSHHSASRVGRAARRGLVSLFLDLLGEGAVACRRIASSTDGSGARRAGHERESVPSDFTGLER